MWKSEWGILLHCWKNCTGFWSNSKFSTWLPHLHSAILKEHFMSVRFSQYLSAILFSEILSRKASKNPQDQSQTFWSATFPFLAPSVWNLLPADLRNILSLACLRSQLKVHLFDLFTNLFMYQLLQGSGGLFFSDSRWHVCIWVVGCDRKHMDGERVGEWRAGGGGGADKCQASGMGWGGWGREDWENIDNSLIINAYLSRQWETECWACVFPGAGVGV